MPEARRARFIRGYGLPAYDAGLLTQSRGLADYFEAAAHTSGNAKAASNWIMGELLRTMKETGRAIEQVALAPTALAGLIHLVDRGTISSTVAKEVFAKLEHTDKSPRAIVQESGMRVVTD